LRKRRPWGERRRVAEFDDRSRHFRQVALNGFGQRLLVSRLTALPFILVHADVALNDVRDWGPRGIAMFSI